MKYTMLALALACPVRPAAAQERIPDDEARKIAKVLLEAAAKVKTPVKVEVDADKPFGKRKGERGALILPAKGISADTVSRVGEAVVPIGQLWLRDLGPVSDDKVVSTKKMIVVPVKHEDRELNLILCVLGVRKSKERPVLEILGKDGAVLAAAPLEKADDKQEMPIEFLVTIEPDERASVVVMIVGKHKARLQVGVLVD